MSLDEIKAFNTHTQSDLGLTKDIFSLIDHFKMESLLDVFKKDLQDQKDQLTARIDTANKAQATAEAGRRDIVSTQDERILAKQGEIDLKGLAQVIAMLAEAGALKAPLPSPEQFVDLQYLRAAGVQ